MHGADALERRDQSPAVVHVADHRPHPGLTQLLGTLVVGAHDRPDATAGGLQAFDHPGPGAPMATGRPENQDRPLKDMLVRESTHGRHSLRLHMSVSAPLRGHAAAAAYQLPATRCAESLRNGVVRCVADWAKPACHRAGHHASLMHLGREDLQTGQRNVAMFADHLAVMVHDNTQPMVHACHSSVSLRSDGNFSAIGEVRWWRHDDNVAVLQPLLYLNASFCLLAADDANALHDTFSDCPHRGFTFLHSDGTFGNCDTRLLRRRWLIFQEAHLGAHFWLDDLQIRPSDLDLDFDRALLAVGCGINLHHSCIKLLVRIRV